MTLWQNDTLTEIKSFRFNSCQMRENILKYLNYKFEFIYLNSNEIEIDYLILFTRVKFKYMTPSPNIIFSRRL